MPKVQIETEGFESLKEKSKLVEQKMNQVTCLLDEIAKLLDSIEGEQINIKLEIQR